MLKKIGMWYFEYGWLISLASIIIWAAICNFIIKENYKDFMFFTGLSLITIIGIIMFVFKYYA